MPSTNETTNNKLITVDQLQQVIGSVATKADERFVQTLEYATAQEVEDAVDAAFSGD